MKKQPTAELKRLPLGLSPVLMDLVRLRIAELHECRWCVHEHIRKLTRNGEMQHRLSQLKEWREMPLFSDREEAALNLAEAITRNPIEEVPSEAFQAARRYFNHDEMICLALAILEVNDWHYLYSKECQQSG